MVTLFFFGPNVVAALGARAFMSLYLGAGIASSAAHVTMEPYRPALGASGSMNAVVAYGICLNPWSLIVVFAEFLPIPMPAALYGAIYIGNDVMAVRWVRAST